MNLEDFREAGIKVQMLACEFDPADKEQKKWFRVVANSARDELFKGTDNYIPEVIEYPYEPEVIGEKHSYSRNREDLPSRPTVVESTLRRNSSVRAAG